jgi:glucokinase
MGPTPAAIRRHRTLKRGKTMEPLILGLDIGGTKIAGGLLTRLGELVAREEVPTEQEKGFAHSSGQMNLVVEALLQLANRQGTKVIGIGACAPGPMEVKKGFLYNPPNLEGWQNLPLGDMLEERFGIAAHIDNDANAAGLAEALWGAGKGHDHVFYATVSTGIGTGIILHRRILHGKNGMAGEGGHVTIQFEDTAARCNCGNIGCIEAYASGTSVAKRARETLKAMQEKPPLLEKQTGGDWNSLTMKHIAGAASRGDSFSQGVIREAGTYLGIWLGSIVSLLDPDIIVIGGGVARIGELLFEAIRNELPRRTINRFAGATPVVRAQLGRDVGIFGAAALVLSDTDQG